MRDADRETAIGGAFAVLVMALFVGAITWGNRGCEVEGRATVHAQAERWASDMGIEDPGIHCAERSSLGWVTCEVRGDDGWVNVLSCHADLGCSVTHDDRR